MSKREDRKARGKINRLQKFGARNFWEHQRELARFVHPMRRKNVLGEFNPYGDNGLGFSLHVS